MVLLAQSYTNLLSADIGHPQFSSSLILLELFHHTLLFVYLFKEIISFIGSLDKCHTSVFNALMYNLTESSIRTVGKLQSVKCFDQCQLQRPTLVIFF